MKWRGILQFEHGLSQEPALKLGCAIAKPTTPLHLITGLCMRAARVKDTTLLAKKFAGYATCGLAQYPFRKLKTD